MRVTIVGTGYVGLVTGACLAAIGHRVVCVDVQPERVQLINDGHAPFHEAGLSELLQKNLAAGNLSATTDLHAALAGSEISLIAVGTPPTGEAVDLSYVEAAAAQIGQALRGSDSYHVVVVKSTVPPGTTDTLVRRTIEEHSGRRAGEFGLCMNPEFLREGSAVHDFMYPDRIVIGEWDARSGTVVESLYAAFDCPKPHTSLRNAELIKYTSNSLLSVLISFSNEIAGLCEAIPGTDVETVMDALHLDKRLSPVLNGQRIKPDILTYLRAGIGFGGSCFPKDVNALRMFAREREIEMPMLDATMQVNGRRPRQVVDLVEQSAGGLSGRTVALLGLAFKPDTDDLRESPSLTIIRHLLERGAVVRAYDPIAAGAAKSLLDTERVTLCDTPEELLTGVDAAVIATAWPEFARWDWAALGKLMRRPVIVDGRSVLRRVQLPEFMIYQTIGQGREELVQQQGGAS